MGDQGSVKTCDFDGHHRDFEFGRGNEDAVEPKMNNFGAYQVAKPFCLQVVKSANRAPEIIKYVGLHVTLSLWGPPSVKVVRSSTYLMILRARKAPNETL